MSKDILLEKEAFGKMMRGLNLAADVVGGTIGPNGRNVYLDDPIQPEIINDGATIASRLVLEDKQEDAGAYVIRNVSSQQNDDVGDGTTTVSVLTQSIIEESMKRPENAMQVSRSLREAGQKLLKVLSKKSVKIEPKDLEKVALISAEEPELARLITEIINKLGEKAVVNVEDSKTFATDYEIVDGYEAPVGFMSPHFADKKTGKAVYEDIPVLVSDKKISSLADISSLFETLNKESITNLVIVCDDIDDSMLGLLVANKVMGRFNALVIRATGDTLRDIEGATGATAVSSSTGITFQNIKLEHLGKAKKVICDANKTLFLGSGVSAKLYAEELEKSSESEPNMYLQKRIKERVAKLRGGIASLRIGAATDFERGYRKRKAEDAIKAVQAALAEGVVEGGGMTLWRMAQEMNPKTIGEEILKKALTSPLRKIIENCGKDYTEVIMGMGNGGYDAKEDRYVDMVESGIIDPSKVTRCALENAVSASATFITTFATITETKNDK